MNISVSRKLKFAGIAGSDVQNQQKNQDFESFADEGFWPGGENALCRPVPSSLRRFAVWGGAWLVAALMVINPAGVAGHNWHEIISAALLMSSPYVALVYQLCLGGHHRTLIRDRVLAPVRAR